MKVSCISTFSLLILAVSFISLEAYRVPSLVSFQRQQLKKFQLKMADFEREEIKVEAVVKTDQSEKNQENQNEESQENRISPEMRKRLLREMREVGNDPNYSRGPVLGNPILIISVVIGVLVLLGGKDIFF
jgi:Sec-independent protein translocase protein TatA